MGIAFGDLRNQLRLTKIVIGVLFSLAVTAHAQDQSSTKIESPPTTTGASQPSDSEPARVFQWAWSTTLYGRSVTGDIEQSADAGILAYGQTQYKLNPYLDGGVGAWARLESGSTSSLYDINRPQNSLWLDEAYVNINPIPDWIQVTGGALNQRFFHNPLFIDEISFPAVREALRAGGANFNASLVFQQAIPTSTTLSTRTVEKEPLPYLTTETLMGTARFTPWLKLNLRVTQFTFSDLPSQVAYDSFTNGNIVNADVPERSSFVYGFSGFTYGGDLGLDLGSGWATRAGADFLHNADAPDEYANALLSFTELEIPLVSSWSLTPRLEYFYSERQSSPAYYNSADYGHNNRQGMAYVLRLASRKEGLAFKISYTDTYLIETDPMQANAQILMLSLEIFNVGS